MKTLKIAFLLLALCVGSFRVSQAQNEGLKTTKATTENSDGCEVITMIPGFDLDVDAGGFNAGFHPKAKLKGDGKQKGQAGFSIEQGLTLTTGAWTLKKCPCPNNPDKKEVFKADVENVSLTLKEDIKNPWNVEVSKKAKILGYTIKAKLQAGVTPTMGGGIDNVEAHYTQRDCSEEHTKELFINGKVNAFIEVKVGAEASISADIKFGATKVDAGKISLVFNAFDVKPTVTTEISYHYKNGKSKLNVGDMCIAPVTATFGEINVTVEFPENIAEFDLNDELDGLFEGYPYIVLHKTCFHN